MRSPTVVIIGGGCSGTLTALQLLRKNIDKVIDIMIVERSSTVGKGLAYEVPSDRCKLNVPVKGMSAFPEEPESFLRWMQALDTTVVGDEFVSRRLYGSYLQDLLRNHASQTPGESLRVINAEALDLSYDSQLNTWTIALQDREPLRADYCVLALGHMRRTSFCGVAVETAFYDPYRKDTYESLRDTERLLLVGSGLTAVDSVLEAEGCGFRGSYTMVSRHGRTPLPHEAPDMPLPVGLPCAPKFSDVSLCSLVRLFVSEARRRGSSQAGMLTIRPHLQEIWCAFSEEDKKRFLRHIRPIWEVHRHRIPKPHHDLLESMKAQGRLSVVPGQLRSVRRDSKGTHVLLESRGETAQLSFDGAILCAGSEADLTTVGGSLVRNLLRRDIITPGKLGLGGFINTEYAGAARLSLIGPIQRESLWEITAVREIREEAKKVATQVHELLTTGG